MAKKQTPFDDDIDSMPEDLSLQQMLDSYVEIDIDSIDTLIESDTNEFLLAHTKNVMENVGINDIDSEEAKIIKYYSRLEVQNLKILRENAEYSRQLLKTKMRHFNSGAHTDNAHLDAFIRLSKHSINIVRETSLFASEIGTKIKNKAEEIVAQRIQDSNEIQKNTDIDNVFDALNSGEDTYKLTQPIVGFRELMKQITESNNQI